MIKRVTFIGSKPIGFEALKTMYSIAPDRLHSIITLDDSNDIRCSLDEFKKFSNQTGRKLHICSKPSKLESIIKEECPEMCIVVGWYWILKENLLKIVPYGFLGVHASLLPKYRGSAPLVWSIINNNKETGVSLFYFDKGIDSGDIVTQERFSIEEEDTIAEVTNKAESHTVEMLKDTYPLLLDGTSPRTPQNHDNATYCSQRKPEDGRINWNETNIQIYNSIRAQTHPYPGAFCYTKDNKKLYIWKSRIFQKEYHGIPGLVVQVSDDYVVVTCGKGAICIYEVQLESSKIDIPSRILKYGARLK
ncbi:MAG: methionyl-tRNA formyltransferase [Candidatus Aegiribacteria sp.]|nr:methionyl-tRNA formyltransferase [Candidatus Aegiribacteria sp.]